MKANLEAMLADLEELVTCESPSADLAAVTRSAEVVAKQGSHHLGAEPERVVVDGCTHLLWRFGEGPRRVLLLGHHDTVWPLGTLETHPWSVEGGIVRGPGCFDMKAGVVQIFHAIEGLRSRQDLDGVTVLITGDEEIGSPTSRALIEKEALGCAAVFVTEASADGGALKTERKGGSIYELVVHGRAAHAGLDPHKGANAAVELAHQIVALTALGDPALGTTVTPTVLSGGTTTNTVPAEARVAVDVRVRSLAEQGRVDAAVRGLRSRIGGTSLDVLGRPNRPPLQESASAELFELAGRVAADLGIGPLKSAAVGGASDGNFTAGMGIPTLDGLGAVGGGAHADDEHVVAAELPARTALLAELVVAVLRDGSSVPTNDEGSDVGSAP